MISSPSPHLMTDPMYSSLRTLAHDRDLAAALGDMVIAWAYAEEALLGAITRILGSRLNLVQAGYYGMPTINARIQFAQGLITEWDCPGEFDKDTISFEIDKLGKLASAPNHWIHGNWCSTKDRSETVIFDHRSHRDSSKRRKPIKSADVNNHTVAVLAKADALSGLIDWESLPL